MRVWVVGVIDCSYQGQLVLADQPESSRTWFRSTSACFGMYPICILTMYCTDRIDASARVGGATGTTRQSLHRQSAKHSSKLKHLDAMVVLGNRPLLLVREVRMRNSDECFWTKLYSSAVLEHAGYRVYQSLMKYPRGLCEPAVCHRVYRWGPEVSACMPGIQNFMPCSKKGPHGSGVTKSLCVSLAGRPSKNRGNMFYLANVVKYWFLHTCFVWGLAKPGSFEAIFAIIIHHLYTCIYFSCALNLPPSCLEVGKIILLLWPNASQNPLQTGCPVSIFQFCSAGSWKSLCTKDSVDFLKSMSATCLSNQLIRSYIWCYRQIRNSSTYQRKYFKSCSWSWHGAQSWWHES